MTAKYLRVINISLAVLVMAALYLVASDLRFTTEAGIAEHGIAKETKTQTTEQPRFEDYSVVLESGTFAQSAKLTLIDINDSATPPKVSRAGQLKDSLILVGTIVDKKGEGYAIFEKKDTNKQEVIKEGALVPGNGVLLGIEKDRAHVKIDDETLIFTMLDIQARAPQTEYAPEIKIPQPQKVKPSPKLKSRQEDRGSEGARLKDEPPMRLPHNNRLPRHGADPAPEENSNPLADIFSNVPDGEFGTGAMGAPFALPPE
ncbi:MAG: hypothetical protein HY880_01400 [Deltaproteobacteria bacterium]|nr:hypothetical protein [Deltaproteobacteria bacterium]